jgi:hypothetical protein
MARGETEETITLLENAAALDEEEEMLLAELYLDEGSLASLTKALELGGTYELEIIQALAALGTDEANELILTWETELPAVQIEQAVIQGDDESVIALAEEAGTDRADELAAWSHLSLEQPEGALAIGEALGDEDIQVASLEMQYELMEENDDLDEDEMEERLQEIEEALEELE